MSWKNKVKITIYTKRSDSWHKFKGPIHINRILVIIFLYFSMQRNL